MLRNVAAFAALVVAGAAGYLTYRYHRDTGHMPYEDTRHTRRWLEREKRRFVKEADAAIRNGSSEARRAFETAKDEFTDRRAALADWFADKEIRPPTREELLALAEQYDGAFAPRHQRGVPPTREAAPQAPAATRGGSTGAGTEEAEPTPAAGRRATHAPMPEDDARPAPGTAAPGGPTRVASAPTEASPTSDDDAYAEGRAAFALGVKHWQAAGEPGSPEEQMQLAAARERFEEAQRHLERAARSRPDDAALERLLTDTNRFLYDCMKRTKLDLAP